MDLRTPPLAVVVLVKTACLSVAVLATAYGFLGWALLNIVALYGGRSHAPLFWLWYAAPWLSVLFIVLSAFQLKRTTWSSLIDPVSAVVFGLMAAYFASRLAKMDVA